MNDRPTPSHDDLTDDELVAAVLDGEATDEQVAAVEADPRLAARLTSFRSVQTELRAAAAEVAVPLTAGADDRIAAALAGFSQGSEDATTTLERPTPLTARRPVRRQRHLSVLAGAAAAIVLVVAVVGLGIRSASDGGDDTAASSASPEATSQQGAGSADKDTAGSAFDEVGGELSTTTAPAYDGQQPASDASGERSQAATATPVPVPQLGDFASTGDLLAAATDPTPWSVVPSTDLPCPDLSPTRMIVRIAHASIRGRPVLVVRDDTQVRVIDLTTCQVVG